MPVSDRGRSEAATTCPIHPPPKGWFDPGCRGCITARADMVGRSLEAANAEVKRLREAIQGVLDDADHDYYRRTQDEWFLLRLQRALNGRNEAPR